MHPIFLSLVTKDQTFLVLKAVFHFLLFNPSSLAFSKEMYIIDESIS